VQYLNARPLYEGLDEGPAAERLSIEFGLPAEVARRIAEDEADVALMPVAAAAALGDMRMVRGAGIVGRGPVRSVLLVSERPIAELTDVALDLSSRTSVVLARLLLNRLMGGKEPRYRGQGPAEALAQVRGTHGAVIIGDAALAVEGKFPYALDLSEAWREWTGLPFVFAAWCGREGALSVENEKLLLQAKERGLARRDSIADAYAATTEKAPHAFRSYLKDSIHYEFGDEEREGLERFFEEGYRAGLLPRTQVRFFDEDRVRPRTRPSIDGVLARAADGERLSAAEGERLLREGQLFDLGLAADAVRKRKHPDGVVTYIVDRNVNYTNVCTTSCRFCAFYRPVGHPEGYVLSREVLGKKLQEVVDAGGVQILLQGGLNPELPITWYEDLFRWMKSEYKLGLHALSPEEILHIAQMEGISVARVLERLHAAGLDSVPGGGAEILVDRVRRTIAKAKCTSDEWLGVMRVAHHMGLRSSCTMMYGTVDTPRDRIVHLLKLRELQDETGGFTAFFCWDFQHEEGTRIAPGENGTHLYLRTQAVARLMLDNVDHVGSSWVTQGPEVGQLALRFGADDFGSVMFEENVVSSAGTTFRMDAAGMETRIRAAGFKAVRRNVRYEWLTEPA
jgi:cyclic dehypoxanthinyl futalosine synthase